MNEFGSVLENVDLKNYTTFKIGGIVRYLVIPENENKLILLINYLKENNIKYFILGNGSNVILDDSFFDGAIILLNKLNKVEINGNFVTASSGVKLGYLNNICLQHGLTSLIFASLIPGCIGASVMGNAGCYNHDLMEFVYSVRTLIDNKVVEIKKSEIEYGYRFTNIKGIILSVTFLLEKGDVEKALKIMKENNKKRILSQPLNEPCVGSIFKNPDNISAGKLIDDLNLKGFHIGGAYISEKHANFIVNRKHATFKDVIDLINYTKEKVYDKYGILLEVEPKIIYWSNL